MVYIKKLVMKGFKSFASETEVPFINGMNTIVGANGSGKSNIADAICFVLGRLSIKSLRADKASNLIFAGTKLHKPSSQASVELVFDNSDKKIFIDAKEIEIERIVRSNGQGIYKINKETKTRQEVLELLAQAGIDPYGFNIVLQGEIDSLIKMHSEERRKIIEEVAGISIYEIRKEKSLRELEKTDERLKEIQATLRERTIYLKNLEEERKQALKYKRLEKDIKRYKASIIKKKLEGKEKEISVLNEKQEKQEREKSRLKKQEDESVKFIEGIKQEIEKINSSIEKSSGIEQEKLHNEISDIRADLAGLAVKKENNEKRLEENFLRKNKAQKDIGDFEKGISELRKESPSQAKKYSELEKKKAELEKIEIERKKFFSFGEKLNALKEKLEDRERNLQRNKNESAFLLNDIEKIASGLIYNDKELCKKDLSALKAEKEQVSKEQEKKEAESRETEKLISVSLAEISNLEKIKKQVRELDICPLCKSKITEEHIKRVFEECDERISELEKNLPGKTQEKNISELKGKITAIESRISRAEIDLIKLQHEEERKEQLKRIYEEGKILQDAVLGIKKEKQALEKKITEFRDVEERYDRIFLEIQEISLRTEENIGTELELKQRELDKIRLIIKQLDREEKELKDGLNDFEKEILEKEYLLGKAEEKGRVLEEKFRNLIEKKNNYEGQIHQNNSQVLEIKSKIVAFENEINNLKIEKARLNAEKENLDLDFKTYENIELFSLPIHMLQEKLNKSEFEMQNIGSVNLRALDVYEKMKVEYDSIAEKVSVLEKEKIEIINIIGEIDKKKRKTFIKTLESINELFNRNFTQLSTKGSVFLEPENKDNIFAAGLDVIIKVGKGKYFDITSLSGGEQTLVALSLIFAIQEYKPYSFYIFDEVDAALDKRNSERLAALIKRYMKTGQYIIVTHNDAIITESSVLYGVSMQEGISKILSLEV